MRVLGFAILAAFIVALPARSRADEEARTAHLDLEGDVLPPEPAMYLPLKDARPEGLVAPAGLVEPRFARIRWGDGPGLGIVVDTAAGHERIWVDADLDGDLTDERHMRWHRTGSLWSRTEDVLVRWGEGETDVTVRFEHRPGDAADRVRIRPQAHRRGHVVLGGRLRAVALGDGNADLRFDDVERDRLVIDLDGDGQLVTSGVRAEVVTPGEPFRVGDEGWRASIASASGGRVVFHPVSPPPPAPPRRWPPTVAPRAGQEPPAVSEDLDAILARIEAEAEGTYAQRYQAIGLLGRLGTEEAARHLLTLARREQEDDNVRAAAIRALGYAPHRAWVGDDVEAIARRGESTLAAAAVQALHGMGHEDRIDIYRDLLGSSDANVVGQAARHLAYAGTPEAREMLASRYRHEGVAATRYQIYLGLRALEEGPPEAILLEAAQDPYASLRRMALEDLHTLDHPRTEPIALEALEDRPVDVATARAAIGVLGRRGTGKAVEALLAFAAEAPTALVQDLEQALAPLRSDAAVEALLDALRDRAVATRRLATRTLAGVVRPDVTEALLGRLRRERETEVQIALLEALGDHGGDEAVEALVRYTRRRNRDVRLAAMRALARIGFAHDAVRRHLLGELDARDWEERVLAIEAAAEAGDPGLCGAVAKSLDHDRWTVRLVAAEALGRLRCPEAIPPLIERLEEEEERRIRDAVGLALYRITGTNLYDDAEMWSRWWEEHGEGFEPPDAVPPLPEETAGGTQAGFYGIPVRSGRIIFVVDQSGSMNAEDAPISGGDDASGGNRLDIAVRAVLRAIADLGTRDRVNVILFETRIRPWRAEMARMSSQNKSALERHLRAQSPTGGTNLFDAIELAFADEDVDTIFLLSDGVPGSGRYVAKDDILRAVERMNVTRRIQIHAVSVGRDSDLLRELAEQHDGRYVRR